MYKFTRIFIAALLVACMLVGCGSKKKNAEKDGASSYEDAVSLLEDMYNGKLKSLEGLAPESYWAWAEEQCEDEDVKFDMDEIMDQYEDWYDSYMESNEDEFGDDIKLSVEIDDEEELDEDDLEKITDALEDQYDIDPKDVDEGWVLDVTMTIEGDEDDDSMGMEMYAVKIDGAWFMLTSYEVGNDLHVSFPAEMFLSGYISANMDYEEDDYNDEYVNEAVPRDYDF